MCCARTGQKNVARRCTLRRTQELEELAQCITELHVQSAQQGGATPRSQRLVVLPGDAPRFTYDDVGASALNDHMLIFAPPASTTGQQRTTAFNHISTSLSAHATPHGPGGAALGPGYAGKDERLVTDACDHK